MHKTSEKYVISTALILDRQSRLNTKRHDALPSLLIANTWSGLGVAFQASRGMTASGVCTLANGSFVAAWQKEARHPWLWDQQH
jgi:hypothetical protein